MYGKWKSLLPKFVHERYESHSHIIWKKCKVNPSTHCPLKEVSEESQSWLNRLTQSVPCLITGVQSHHALHSGWKEVGHYSVIFPSIRWYGCIHEHLPPHTHTHTHTCIQYTDEYNKKLTTTTKEYGEIVSIVIWV